MNWIRNDLEDVRHLWSFNLTDPEQLKETSHFSNLQAIK